MLLPPLVLVAAMTGYGFVRLSQNPVPVGALRTAVIQPNMRSDRTAPDSATHDLEVLGRLASGIAAEHPQLVIYPETVAPRDAINDQATRVFFARMARQLNAYVLVGTGYEDAQERPYNSAALFTPRETVAGRYDKHWLVPMGEWIPLRNWMPFADVFHFPKYDVVPGTTDAPMQVDNARFTVLICYETVFPQLPRTRVSAGAELLASITNDSWAGRSPEIQQHLAMGVLRAVETGRALAIAATTGVTGFVDRRGHVSAIPPYREGALVQPVPLYRDLTLYVRLGDWFVLLCACVVVFALASARRAEANRPQA